jgi:hypothetical protein
MLTEAMAKRTTLDFLKTESASGAILAAAAALAILLANSPWAGAYFGFIDHRHRPGRPSTRERLWLGEEGPDAVFFFVVLEINTRSPRRTGQRRLALPVLAALGGWSGISTSVTPAGRRRRLADPVATDAPARSPPAAGRLPATLHLPAAGHRRRPGRRRPDRRCCCGGWTFCRRVGALVLRCLILPWDRWRCAHMLASAPAGLGFTLEVGHLAVGGGRGGRGGPGRRSQPPGRAGRPDGSLHPYRDPLPDPPLFAFSGGFSGATWA